ncbi:flavin reductase family protein [Acidocella sp.]|uniref:flavin reductase family protein n=1 Tax=Acidocella sp. TaxID=50710 RepID=UPI003D03F050
MSNDLRAAFLAGMGHVACTVNVITTDGPAGRLGVTVSAMSSVSADGPHPTLLVCVHHLSTAARAIAENGVFCVNVLRADQAHISDHFAGRVKAEDKFSCADWAVCANGAPRLADPLAAFECDMLLDQRIGTHHVFYGAVRQLHFGRQGQTLIYAARNYGVPGVLPVP